MRQNILLVIIPIIKMFFLFSFSNQLECGCTVI
jgi:hypothetical protein